MTPDLAALAEDKLVMYLAVRASLGMDVGKIAAQVGHTVQLLLDRREAAGGRGEETTAEWERWKDWRASEYAKIVLVADDKEFEKLKGLSGSLVVVDNGHTEVAAGSETVVGFPPMWRSQRPSILKRCRLLKSISVPEPVPEVCEPVQGFFSPHKEVPK